MELELLKLKIHGICWLVWVMAGAQPCCQKHRSNCCYQETDGCFAAALGLSPGLGPEGLGPHQCADICKWRLVVLFMGWQCQGSTSAAVSLKEQLGPQWSWPPQRGWSWGRFVVRELGQYGVTRRVADALQASSRRSSGWACHGPVLILGSWAYGLKYFSDVQSSQLTKIVFHGSCVLCPCLGLGWSWIKPLNNGWTTRWH